MTLRRAVALWREPWPSRAHEKSRLKGGFGNVVVNSYAVHATANSFA